MQAVCLCVFYSEQKSGTCIVALSSNAQLNKLISELKCLVSSLGPSIINGDVLALGIAQIAQAAPQRLYFTCPTGSGTKTQISDAPHLCRLLRADRRREQSRAAQKRNKLTPFHICHPVHCRISQCQEPINNTKSLLKSERSSMSQLGQSRHRRTAEQRPPNATCDMKEAAN
jgi:hypothetical protein